MKPRIIPHPQSEWKGYAYAETQSSYEKIGIAPGAFYNPTDGAVHAGTNAVLGAVRGDPVMLKLFVHEYGHAMKWPLHDHPTSPWQGFLHAAKVGFDVRAFTRLLRFRKGDAKRWKEATAWLDAELESLGA